MFFCFPGLHPLCKWRNEEKHVAIIFTDDEVLLRISTSMSTSL